ncbi:MAG TPA: ABC transporter ATP-binding protein [Kofleriaceae bacterium]|jgi:putative ABC transport system ATP-binding protein|nr:ABC transporter ATP-binding protein [Kofleriaceae bacterium]
MEIVEASPNLSDLMPKVAPSKGLLELTQIGKTFHTDDVETRALANVELAVGKGEFLSISGPSGSGKSTLLAILGLLDIPTAGEYRIDGQDTAKLDPVRRAAMRNKAIGFIFQAFNLIGDLTVAENVELPLTYRGMPVADRRKRVETALESVQMSHRARHLPAQLSGGQQQRVAVARAVAGDPLILLADEPTGNLDSKNGDAVMEMLCGLHAKGATICMVTHNEEYARKATRVVHLFDGRIVEDRRG